jgi:DNA-binding transcriptional regulator YdaS (Cro superfamily)
MELKTYLAELSAAEREAFAAACDCALGHLNNITSNTRTCGEKLAIAIERETKGKVRCEEMRPDVDWAFLRGTAKARKSVTAQA